jgi:uncharacterized protein YggE
MSNPSTITVEATGTAMAPPDVARIRLSTFAEDPAPGEALTMCSLLSERVLAALREAGVLPDDLESTSIELNEHYRHDTEPPVRLYRASAGLSATVRPPKQAGRVMAAAVDAAGTGVAINNVSFDIDDRAPLFSLARRQAVELAIGAAAELAEAAGMVLGALVELVEADRGRPRPERGQFKAARRAQAAGAPPVELGELSVAVSVAVSFEVAPVARS